MRAIICGGRKYSDFEHVKSALSIYKITAVIQGGAGGADLMAREWAENRNIPLVTYPAHWAQGRKAGPLRNQFMLEDSRPDVVIAFPGGAGTADMCARANNAGILVITCTPGEP